MTVDAPIDTKATWLARLWALAVIACAIAGVVWVVRAYPEETLLWMRILVLEARQIVASHR